MIDSMLVVIQTALGMRMACIPVSTAIVNGSGGVHLE
jgi:hypothetical protein